MKRLLVLCLTPALIVGLTTAAPAVAAPHRTPTAATPAPAVAAASVHNTVAQAEAKLINMTVGPGTNSFWGKARIIGWQVSSCGAAYQASVTNVTFEPPTAPAPTTAKHAATAVSPATVPCPSASPGAVPAGTVNPAGGDWWNPFTWHWFGDAAHPGILFGGCCDSLVPRLHSCVYGAAAGTFPALSGEMIWQVLIMGGKLTTGPGGYAVLAIGGCTFGLVFNS